MKNNNVTPTKRIRKVSYVRDLGGLKTSDGRTIKPNLLFRTSHLSKLKHQKGLDKLNIKQVFDLRTNEEVMAKPELNYSNINYHHLPVLSNEDNPLINRKSRLKVLKELNNMPGGTANYLASRYKILVTSEDSLNYYRDLMIKLNESNDASIWHCTQGKDRTGVATMILLMILGADEQTIIDDYLSYNRHVRFKNFMIRLGITVLMLNHKLAKALMPLLEAQEKFINEAINEIKNSYSDFKSFITNGLKLDEATIYGLQEKYLY